MKTTIYNPSPIETEIANALVNLQGEMEKHLKDKKISKISSDLSQDNPSLKITLMDSDGDQHEIVLKIVQIPDKR
jgi:hypothetical protein